AKRIHLFSRRRQEWRDTKTLRPERTIRVDHFGLVGIVSHGRYGGHGSLSTIALKSGGLMIRP
ncbi:MAG: hypothetical protein ACJAWF_004086, partial [Candidatus Azotimanducaceae bacterium]